MAEYIWSGANNAALPAEFQALSADNISVENGAGSVKRPGGGSHGARLSTSSSDYVRMVFRAQSGDSGWHNRALVLRSTSGRNGYTCGYTSNGLVLGVRKAASGSSSSGLFGWVIPVGWGLDPSTTETEVEFWLEESEGTITFHAAINGTELTDVDFGTPTDSTDILTGGNPGWWVDWIAEADGLMGTFADTVASASVPTITSVTPSTVAASTNPVIAGTNFGATQGGGSVIISPTDDSSDVNAVTQTIGAWADDEITLDGVSFPTGTAHEDTLYLFVINDDQEANAAGETIAAYIAPLLTNPTQVNVSSTTVTPRVTTTVNNGTAYYVIFPQGQTDPTKEQIAAGNGADDEPAEFDGSMSVDTAGVLTFPEVTGLDPAVAYRIGYTHNGDPNA